MGVVGGGLDLRGGVGGGGGGGRGRHGGRGGRGSEYRHWEHHGLRHSNLQNDDSDKDHVDDELIGNDYHGIIGIM